MTRLCGRVLLFHINIYRPTDSLHGKVLVILNFYINIHRPTDTRHSRVLVVHDSVDPRKAKVLRTHAAPQGLCDNLINSLKLFTNQQKDGDSLDEHFVTGLLEKSRKDIVDQESFVPCAGKYSQRDAMVNLLPRQSKMTKYFLMK